MAGPVVSEGWAGPANANVVIMLWGKNCLVTHSAFTSHPIQKNARCRSKGYIDDIGIVTQFFSINCGVVPMWKKINNCLNYVLIPIYSDVCIFVIKRTVYGFLSVGKSTIASPTTNLVPKYGIFTVLGLGILDVFWPRQRPVAPHAFAGLGPAAVHRSHVAFRRNYYVGMYCM